MTTSTFKAPAIILLVVGGLFISLIAVLIGLVLWFLYYLSNPDYSLQFSSDVGPEIRTFIEESPITGGDISIEADLPDLDAQVFTIEQCGALCDSSTTYYGIAHGDKIGFLVNYIYVDAPKYDDLVLYDFDATDVNLYTGAFIATSINQENTVHQYDDFVFYSLAKDADTPRTVLYNIASGYYYTLTSTESSYLHYEIALVLMNNATVLDDKEILALIATRGSQAYNGVMDARILALQRLDFQLPEEDLMVLRDTFRMEGVQALQDALIERQRDVSDNPDASVYPTGTDLETALVPKYLKSLPTNPITQEQYHYAWYPADDPQKMQVWVELEQHNSVLDATHWSTKANLDTTQPGWAGDTVDGTVTTCTPAQNDCIYDLSSLFAFMDEL
jgi:hypothetical protein